MIVQYTAAALASENKVLAHPSSADSIPTSANQEDHVSMGAAAARHARTVLGHVEQILAIELLCAAQALDLRLALMGSVAEGSRGAGARRGRRRSASPGPRTGEHPRRGSRARARPRGGARARPRRHAGGSRGLSERATRMPWHSTGCVVSRPPDGMVARYR